MASVLGCGNTYRPVVSAINPVGPAAQPQKFAVAISTTGTATANTTATFNSGGNTGYTLNSDHTLTTFDISTALLQSQILQTTLLPGANPVSIFPGSTSTYVSDPGLNAVSQFTGQPLNLQQQLSVSPAFSPLYVVSTASSPRAFVISPRVGGGLGQVSTIEATSNTIDPNPIPVGQGPVYGIMTADARRAFILNQTDGTVSVINTQTNQLDIVPAGATNPITVGASPLWADFAPTRNELVVANAGDGVHPGSASIISIPLCSATALPNNPNCDPNNPVDAVGFGTTLATVPTGINSIMVSVLQDGTRAYVANQGDPTLPCALPPAVPGVSTVCSVSIINLTTNTLIQTLYALPDNVSDPSKSPCTATNKQTGTLSICGHPVYIAATTGTPTGKVYIVSKDSQFMSVIRTDTDVVDTLVPLQGNGVSVRITAP
jgi:DNA-binding beta-propeller fold protein YncE